MRHGGSRTVYWIAYLITSTLLWGFYALLTGMPVGITALTSSTVGLWIISLLLNTYLSSMVADYVTEQYK